MESSVGGAILAIAQQAARQNAPQEGDYRGDDGLLYCGQCHKPKQCFITFSGKTLKMSCICDCKVIEEKARRLEEAIDAARRMRERSHVSTHCTFERATMTPELRKCNKYADHWEDMKQSNTGLLLWGDVGTGKTYAAHCICNAVMKRLIPVSAYATSMSRILNGGFDRTEEIERVRRIGLLVLDDLGAERGSEYALETVFTIVDERYRAKKPLIVTSNITLEEMQMPKDRDGCPDKRRKRIYDRILELCVPICFHGASNRGRIAAEKLAELRSIM